MSDPNPSAPDRAILPDSELDFWTARYTQSLDDQGQSDGQVYVIARIGSERFAIPMQDLDEVASVTTGIALPHVSHRVLGLANIRGELLPLLDTGALLGISASHRLGAANRTLVVRDQDGRRTGLPVDAVESVETLDPNAFQPQSGRPDALIRRLGLGEHEGHALSLLDVTPLRQGSISSF